MKKVKASQAKSNPAGEGSLGHFCNDGGSRQHTAQPRWSSVLSCLVEGSSWTKTTEAGKGRGFLQRNRQPQEKIRSGGESRSQTVQHGNMESQVRKVRKHTAFKKEEVSLVRVEGRQEDRQAGCPVAH